MNWSDLLGAFALMLVLEGLLPFLSPASFKQKLLQILSLPDKALRIAGFLSMMLGLFVLYMVRH